MHAAISAQQLQGTVTNLSGQGLPNVNLYVKELETGTYSDLDGKYLIILDPGHYEIVFSCLGYVTQSVPVIIHDLADTLDIQMKPSDISLEEVLVKAKQKDAAYEIIQKVIENKKKFLRDLQSYKSNVYIKATELLTEKERRKRRVEIEVPEEDDISGDPFDTKSDKTDDPRSKINMCEMLLELNYEFPGRFKEIRTGFKTYGDRGGLFIPSFSQTEFNFYRNLVNLRGISEVPVISPFSNTAILTYKYKLESSQLEEGILVHKIRVTPRKSGNASCNGYVYINEGTWNINRLDLSFSRGGLKFFDSFGLVQNYQLIQDSFWLVNRQEFNYESKQSNRKSFTATTLIAYSDIKPNYPFPARFFGNEVSVTTREALERDSSYWTGQRVEPLTEEQQRVANYRDSIDRVHKSKVYLDSTQRAYNKVTAGEVLWHGLGFRNNHKKSDVYFTSLLDLIGFEVIGGLRLGPYASYFRRWESGRMMRTSGNLSMGFKNADIQGNFNFWSRYDPYHLGDFGFSTGRGFQSINNFDAYLNQLKRSNYILRDYVTAYHRIELLNGFYFQADADYSLRRSVDSYDSKTFIGDIIEDDVPVVFDNYKALTTGLALLYTPGQKYLTEPNRKVVLGSRYPTFQFTYRKGWNLDPAGSIDWDYLEAAMGQQITLGTLGNSKYTMRMGKFVNTTKVPYVDLLRFRQSDPYLFSSPLGSFQLLDTSFATTDLFLEAHYIHHFNGALMNNLPLIKKLKLRIAVGGGVLYIRESNFRQQELFTGVERIFKIGARRRLRLGIFGVVGDSNFSKLKTGLKFSLDIIDTWKKDWSH